MHYNLTKLNSLRFFRTKNIFQDLYKININFLTLNSDAALTHNNFSGHTNQPESRFCKPNLKSSLIMQSQLDTLHLVDTNIIRRKQNTTELLTLPWHNWADGGYLTAVTKHKHPSGLTSTRANRPAMSSSKR